MLAVFIKSSGADALQLAPGESRLQNVGGINGAFGRTRANQGVNLINHEDHIAGTADLLHDLFETLLKLTPVFGAGHQQADIKGENALIFENVGNFTLSDALGQAFS